MIRPPGAAPAEFSALCVRCGACVRVCPTQGLQPSLFEGGVQNVLTPRLVPRLGYCGFGCNACGQVCPTGAIPELTLEEKQSVIMGLASIDQDRCLPWAYNIPCIVCEEVCPVADKAVTLEEVEALFEDFTAMMTGSDEVDPESLGDLEALVGVRKFPVRVKCATLAWHTLHEALDALGSSSG